MSLFHYSICDPLKPEVQEMGAVSDKVFINVLNNFQWIEELEKLKTAEKESRKIYYNPSLELRNEQTDQSLAISIVGEPDNYEFYIFYKRGDALTDRMGQTIEDVHDAFHALLEGRSDELEERWG